MYYRLLDFLCCPYDKTFPLTLEAPRTCQASSEAPSEGEGKGICCQAYCGYRETPLPSDDGTKGRCAGCLDIWIEEGELHCPSCDRRYPIRDGIPRLLPDELAVGSDTAPDDEAGRIKWLQQRQRNDEAEVYEADFVPFSTEVDQRLTLQSLDPQPQDLILDAGSGPGRLTRCLTGRSREIVALDFAHKVLELLHRTSGHRPQGSLLHSVIGDVEHKPLRDGLFDKVVSFGILEHLPDQATIKSCLAEARRVMKPGARIMITAYSCTPIRKAMARVLGIDYGVDGWHNEIFFHRAQLEEMKELIEGSFPEYEIRGSRNFPRQLGQKLRPFSTAIDVGITGTPLSRLSGYYFLVKATAS